MRLRFLSVLVLAAIVSERLLATIFLTCSVILATTSTTEVDFVSLLSRLHLSHTCHEPLAAHPVPRPVLP